MRIGPEQELAFKEIDLASISPPPCHPLPPLPLQGPPEGLPALLPLCSLLQSGRGFSPQESYATRPVHTLPGIPSSFP